MYVWPWFPGAMENWGLILYRYVYNYLCLFKSNWKNIAHFQDGSAHVLTSRITGNFKKCYRGIHKSQLSLILYLLVTAWLNRKYLKLSILTDLYSEVTQKCRKNIWFLLDQSPCLGLWKSFPNYLSYDMK